VKDYDSRVLLANKTMARFYNLSVEEVTGELQSDLHRRHGADPNDIHKWLADDREVIETGQPIHLVETGTDSENRLHWFETAKYPIDIGQGRCGALVISQDITERKLAEEALRESKQLLERTFASLHDAVFIVDAETVEILDCNPAASKMFGHGRQEILGRTTAFLHVDEASLQEFRARLYPAVDEKGFLVLPESRMKRKDGTVFPTEHSVLPLENDQGQCVGWVSVVRDITHRKQTEEALRRREQDMRLIADNAPALVSYVDAEGCYRFVNKQYEEWFDMPRTEIIGKHCSDILGEAAYEAIRERVETVLSGQRVRYEEALPYMRGGPRWVIAEYVPDVDEQGRVNGFFALVTDITERKRAEQALRRSAEETARSQRMLLALSQAAQAVQRAHTSEEVFHTVGDEITKLGYQATVFTLADDREHLMVSFLTFESALVRAAERLTGLLAQDYTFPLVPGGFFQRLITEGGTAFTEGTAEPLAQALPKPVRPLVGRLADLLKWEESIVVPLKTGGEVFGLLAVTGAGLTEADVPAVTAFANQAAIALENARLYEAERSAHEQLRHLASHLRDAREQERKRVAREIHDELGQSLTALKFDISRLARQLPEGEPVLRERVAAMAALIDGSIHTVQRVSTELRPGLLDDLGLAAAIEWQVEEFAERTGIRCDLHLSEEDVRLESDMATALFRILQETLTNVARHAGANEVQVELAVDPREVVLKVRDDGRGITESEISSTQALGLLGMRERARTLGGEVTFEGVRGQGTTVTVRIPYDLTRMTRMDESEA
jgi:PAS domain S-box-containing protein